MPHLDAKSHDVSHILTSKNIVSKIQDMNIVNLQTRRNLKSNKTYTQDIKIKSEMETSRIRT